MKVILTQDVKGLGKAGELVNAKPGYFNNFIAKNQWGVAATPEAIRKWKAQQAALAEQERQNRAKAEALKARIEAMTLILHEKTGSGSRLFGSVTNGAVAEALSAQLGEEIDKKKVEMKDSIRTLGTYTVGVRVYPEMVASLKLQVEEA